MNKHTKGITLVALVVTIIVLLIISGVAVSMITGYNGLFGMANSSADKYNQNSLSEAQRLQEIYSHLLLADSEGTVLENVDMTTLKTLIQKEVQDAIAKVAQVPTGTIIAQMGNSAPAGYLICNGGEYEISEYEALANYFETQFGNKQYFGGTGTMFKVPNLSGEFLRGTGTNEYTAPSGVKQGNGANVGTHQDATEIPNLQSGYNNSLYIQKSSIAANNTENNVSRYNDSGTATYSSRATYAASSTNASTTTYYPSRITLRPTNTSVLYCIKI